MSTITGNSGASLERSISEIAAVGKRLATWPKYGDLKDSGLHYLGDIPKHWEIKRLKFIAKINSESLPEEFDSAYEIEYIDIGNVDYVRGVLASESLYFEDAPSRARRRVRGGDTLISTVRTYLKAIAFIEDPPENLIASTGFAVLRPHSGIDPEFLFRLVQSNEFIETVVAYSVGVTYPAIAPTVLGRLPVWLPPLNEQRAIAAFLRRETAKIDGLIDKKRRLIELLKEKRTALISHAVIKGLNPDAPMKPSGIDWLGDVPEHWEIKRLKFVGHISYGLGEPPDRHVDGIPFIRATDIERGKINGDAVQRIDPDDVPWNRAIVLRPKDILVVRSGAYTGDSAIIPPEWAGSIAGYDLVLRVIKADPDYIAFALLSRYLLQGQIFLAKSRAAQPHLNAQELGECHVILAPIDEQEEIAKKIAGKCQSIDSLLGRIRNAIDSLAEYRSALVSAAVTGKIDIRDHAPDNPED